MSESTEYEWALVRPHAFLLSMRDAEGQLLPGITVEDMGTKTVANDLDNARVWFDKATLTSGRHAEGAGPLAKQRMHLR